MIQVLTVAIHFVGAAPAVAAPALKTAKEITTIANAIEQEIENARTVIGKDDNVTGKECTLPGDGQEWSWRTWAPMVQCLAQVAITNNDEPSHGKATESARQATQVAHDAATALKNAANFASKCSAAATNDPKAWATCAEKVAEIVELASDWESETLSAIPPSDTAGGKITQQMAYDIARRAKESVQRTRANTIRTLEVAIAKCRMGGHGDACDIDDARDLGIETGGFDTNGLRVASEQLKATGAGAIPAPAVELLDATTKIAVKRAKRAALGLVHDQLEHSICDAKWPNASTERVFPRTCDFVGDTTIETLAKDPRRIQPALVADLTDVVAEKALNELTTFKVSDPQLLEVVRLAVDLTGRVRAYQVPNPSHVDALALLSTARRLTHDGKLKGSSALALESLALYVSRQGRVDIMSIIEEIDDSATLEIRQRAVELALLGIRGLGLAHEPTPADEHGAWVATIDMVLQIAIDELDFGTGATSQQKKEREIIEGFRRLVVAIADENVPAAVSAATELAASTLYDACKPPDPDPDELGRCREIEKAAALVSAVASYAATYTVAGQAEKSEAELRAARAESIEDLVDATTRRSNRHGDWVVSLGMPIGFFTGLQWLRERDSLDPANASWNPRGMAPQLELPLGFGIQRLVGRRFREGKRVKSSRRYADGFHLHFSVLDLGQFLAYDTAQEQDSDQTESDMEELASSISRPRWDSIIGLGAQLGWGFGRPDHMFVLAGGFRYAPTLFAETQALVVNDRKPDDGLANVAGAMRVGFSLTYYVSLFDFN